MNTFLVDSFWTEPPTTEEAPTRPVTSGKSKQKPEYPKEEEFVFRRSYPSFIWFISLLGRGMQVQIPLPLELSASSCPWVPTRRCPRGAPCFPSSFGFPPDRLEAVGVSSPSPAVSLRLSSVTPPSALCWGLFLSGVCAFPRLCSGLTSVVSSLNLTSPPSPYSTQPAVRVS